eukprot:GABV01000982.1.p1 GENE.GABV01000982.1~~GABV01000982.1.p1  ORF type:complete len:319 (+),score=68.87 GABV01000982.1:124-957(+)
MAMLDATVGLAWPKAAWEWADANLTDFDKAFYVAVVVNLGFYMLSGIPNVIFSQFSFFDKYKIQKDSKQRAGQPSLGEVLKYVVLMHLTMYMPLALGMALASPFWDSVKFNYEDLPAWYMFIPKLIAAHYIEDLYHYLFHRALHHPTLYWIHKVHHSFPEPYAIVAGYAHPIEQMLLGAGFMIPAMIFTDHVAFWYIWNIARIFETAEAHLGYEIPWLPLTPFHYLPFWGGASFHDFHHSHNAGNFASTFTLWDKLFGTNTAYVRFQNEGSTAKKVE